ncbi:hypothetical protein Hanom_Chr11g01024261 [Helianthus anomalus]
MVNMKLIGNKLLVNVAKFAKENDGSRFVHGRAGINKEGFVNQNGMKTGGPSRKQPPAVNGVSNGRSFVDILMNKSRPVLDEDVEDADPSVFSLSDKFGKALVGRTASFAMLRSINVLLREAGFQDIVIQYFGGLTVLLSFNDEMCAKNFAEESVFGLSGFLPSIPGYGRVIHGSQCREDDGDLTFDCLGVLTDNGNSISGVVKLRWQDKIYRVWVKEEPSAWVPNCLGNINWVDDLSSESDGGNRDSSDLAEGGDSVKGDVEAEEVKGQPVDPHEDPGPAAHVVSGEVPMHVDSGNNYVSPVGVAFHAQGPTPPHSYFSRPSFKDQWANLVAHSISRPRKRIRSGDSDFEEDFVGHVAGSKGDFISNCRVSDLASGSGRGVPIDKDKINLNVLPVVSNVLPVDQMGVGERTEDSPVGSVLVDDTQERIKEEEIIDTVSFGRLVGVNLVGFKEKVEKIIRDEEGINEGDR